MDAVIVRHNDIGIMEQMTVNAKMPIINAMTNRNHPCEMMADMYALSKIRDNFVNDKYLFVGAAVNIGYAWKEAAKLIIFQMIKHKIKGKNKRVDRL